MRYDFVAVPRCNMCGSDDRRQLGLRMNRSQGLRPRAVSGIAVSVMKCRNCGLIYADPLPVPERLEDHYGVPAEEYWTSMAPWSPDYFAPQIAAAKRLLPFSDGMKALDIGAGRGLTMRSLERAGFDSYGLEPSPPFRNHAIRSTGIDAARLQLATLEDADYPAASFDFITFGAVLEHLYDPSAALGKALGWLKPNGIVHAEVPSSRHLIPRFINGYFRLRGTNFVTHISPMHSPFHLYEFDLRSFEENARRWNYSVAEATFEVCEISHVPGFLKPAFRWWMNRTDQGMQLTVYLRKER